VLQIVAERVAGYDGDDPAVVRVDLLVREQ